MKKAMWKRSKRSKRSKRAVCLALILFLVFSAVILPNSGFTGTVHAASGGFCGDHLTWKLDNNGTVTISGNGPMTDYDFNESPWTRDNSIKKVVISNGVTRVGAWAFVECVSLTGVSIPNSVTSIGFAAFSGCVSLTSINIPNSVTSIGSSALSSCESLTSITIPGSVKKLDNSLFCNCFSLKNLTISSGVKTIGTCAFSSCTSLTSVVIPDSVDEISISAFSGCDKLTSVTIPDGVTAINSYTFAECTSLKSVGIPASVTSIGYSAFKNCTSLTDVYYYGTEADYGKVTFKSENDPLLNATVHYVPKVSLKYNANGGSGAPAAQTVYQNKTVTVSSTKPTRSGYAFVAWNTKAAGTGKVYKPGQSFTLTSGMTLYAMWVKTPSYTLTTTAASTTSTKLNWTYNAPTKFIEVWRADKANAAQSDYKKIAVVDASAKTYTVKNLTLGKTYYYKIRGYFRDSANVQVYTSGYTSPLAARVVPKAPYNVKATVQSSTTVKLNWTADPDVQFVEVWRTHKANAVQSEYVQLGIYYAKDGTSMSRKLTPGKTYYYKFRGYSYDANGKRVYSAYSTIVSATPK